MVKITEWKTFIHPHQAYRLEFPAHWEHRVQKEGESCGFGPYERDNVGLWISIMPASLDTDRIEDDLPKLFQQAVSKSGAVNVRKDETLAHHGYKADITDKQEGGHHWILAGGDLVLFATSQVPHGEEDAWDPSFARLMSSLRITREDELWERKLCNEVLALLREKRPEQDYQYDEKGIRGRDHVLYLGNLLRDVKSRPKSRAKIIRNFVDTITSTDQSNMGYEDFDEVKDQILPLLKPEAYFKDEGPTSRLIWQEWLADVRICYAIKGHNQFRFINDWDTKRWELDAEDLHQRAIENLSKLTWPERMEGCREERGGRLILVDASDGFAASRLLHPEFHRIFCKPLDSPFLAGIPDRDTLVAFSNRRSIRKRIARQVRKDHDSSPYQITPRLFLVTPDGIALAPSV